MDLPPDVVTAETFAGRLGERFSMELDGGVEQDVELIELTRLGDQPTGGSRAPFSIVFRGPAGPVAPQRIYRFRHAELGELELFVVPIGADGEGVRYEAIFT
jgi:hypothetical protein